MANESLLTSLLRGPDGRAQSFLEGIFNPTVGYYEISKAVFGHLSNDDHNALRRTNSTMDSSIMALRSDGSLLHKLEWLRHTCDVKFPATLSHYSDCPNGLNSSARLTRCSRQEHEPGFESSMADCHDSKEVFLVCTTCDERIRRQYDGGVDGIGWTKWPVCYDCGRTQSDQYPQGALLCDCIATMHRRVLCDNCTTAKLEWMINEAQENLAIRDTICRDKNGEVKFNHRPRYNSTRCLGCGVKKCDWDYDSWDPENRNGNPLYYAPLICVHCRKYLLAPKHQPPSDQWTPVRRSTRLNQGTALIRLSYHGAAARPNTEAQGPHGFSS